MFSYLEPEYQDASQIKIQVLDSKWLEMLGVWWDRDNVRDLWHSSLLAIRSQVRKEYAALPLIVASPWCRNWLASERMPWKLMKGSVGIHGRIGGLILRLFTLLSAVVRQDLVRPFQIRLTVLLWSSSSRYWGRSEELETVKQNNHSRRIIGCRLFEAAIVHKDSLLSSATAPFFAQLSILCSGDFLHPRRYFRDEVDSKTDINRF